MASKGGSPTRRVGFLGAWLCSHSLVNSIRCTALQEATTTTIELVQLAGPDFHEQAHGLPVRIREVVVHGVHHGAAAALGVDHLRLLAEVDLRTMEPGFPPRAEVPEDVYVR